MPKSSGVVRVAPRFKVTEESQAPLLCLPKDIVNILVSQLNTFDAILVRSTCKSLFNTVAELHPRPPHFVLNQFAWLDYLVAHGYLSCLVYCKSVLNFFFPSELCNTAAKHGQLATLKFLVDECDCAYFGMVAIEAVGHMDVLKHVFETLKINLPTTITDLASRAAEKGDIESMKYIMTKGFPLDEQSVGGAVRNEHVEFLRFARQNVKNCKLNLFYTNNIAIWEEFCEQPADLSQCLANALWAGDFDRTKWILDRYTEYNPKRLVTEATAGGNVDCLKYVVEVCKAPTAHTFQQVASLDCLKYLVENAKDARFDPRIYHHAISNCQRDFVAYAVSKGIPFPSYTAGLAARTGDFEFFKWGVEQMGFNNDQTLDNLLDAFGDGEDDPMDDVFNSAIVGQNLQILQYAFEKFPLRLSVAQLLREVFNTLIIDFIPFIKYLLSVPITSYMIDHAVKSCSVEVLEYLENQLGAKFSQKQLDIAAITGNFENFAFLLTKIDNFSIGENLSYRLLMAKYAYGHNAALSPKLQSLAIDKDNVDSLRFLVHTKTVAVTSELHTLAVSKKATFCAKFLSKRLNGK